ncbi:Unc-50 protein 1 [Fasciola hepatica]|uniref:Unc-50 protein 1 n=1 Tax=Fasciola hepatica TaxID=6192 RepID=A0A4E0R1C4_FASHE|nr:Unc-50 protein 1 [Fasciola hepatica]
MSPVGSVFVDVRENTVGSVCSNMFRCAETCRPLTINRILSAAEKRSRYMRRLLNVKHMDFEHAFWEMLQLLISPQKLFRNFRYRNCSRRQWARDDPAFLVLVVCTVLFFSILVALFMGLNLAQSIKLIFWSLFWGFFVIALTIPTFYWIITNRFFVDTFNRMPHTDILSESSDSFSVPEVEWGYAFDVHLNAFFPALLITGYLQLPFVYFSMGETFVSRLIGNTFWLAGGLYYNYITFLGYSALPYLRRTTVLLMPMNVLVFFYLLAMGLHWNANTLLWHFLWFQI